VACAEEKTRVDVTVVVTRDRERVTLE